MGRKIKWRLQFKSLNNTDCTVNIYEEGYTGSTITPLIGAAVPFEIQEEDSNDLTRFVRHKTAYLRVVETTYGELDALMPTSIRHHFVEAYYGSERVFTGFMQCQQFDNGWVAAPRELEFPLVSPLGLLDSFNFSVPSELKLVTLGSLMNELMIGLNPYESSTSTSTTSSDYGYVIYPRTSSYSPWDNLIHSTVMCPFNDSFKHYDESSKLFSPRDYRYFIEGICACFGWTVHDTPSAIVFAQYDYTGNYSRLSVSGLKNLTGWESVQQLSDSFNSYYSNADNNALQSQVMPLKEVVLELEEPEIKKKSLGTSHTTSSLGSVGINSDYNLYAYARLTQIGPDVNGDHIGTPNIGTEGQIYSPGLYPLAYGTAEQNAVTIGVQENWWLKYSTGWSAGSLLLKVIFYGMMPINSNGECLLKLQIERGTSMFDMKVSDYTSFTVNLVIKVGSKYYNMTNDTMTSSFTLNAVTINGATGKVTPNKTLNGNHSDVDGILFRPWETGWGVIDSIEVSLYDSGITGLADGEYLKFSEVSIANPSTTDESYNSYYRNVGNITIGNNQTGTEDRSINVNFYNYSGHRGEHSFGNSNGSINGEPPTFPYLFRPMVVLQQKVRQIAAINFNEYAAKWTYWIYGWRWRMLAKSFNLRDDEFTITLARSSTIE